MRSYRQRWLPESTMFTLALHDDYPSSQADWLGDLQRDLHPEREVAWWERLAGPYVAYTRNRELSARQRTAAFNVLLN
jgi:hypothetical protein